MQLLHFIQHDITISWLVFGFLLVLIEASFIPGLGLLFAGIGAVLTGGAISCNLIHATDYVSQTFVFLAATAIGAAILWQPLKKLKHAKGEYNGIIGQHAIVCNQPLVSSKIGQVSWSGTIMNAALSADHEQELAVGSKVTIVKVNGNILTVKPNI